MIAGAGSADEAACNDGSLSHAELAESSEGIDGISAMPTDDADDQVSACKLSGRASRPWFVQIIVSAAAGRCRHRSMLLSPEILVLLQGSLQDAFIERSSTEPCMACDEHVMSLQCMMAEK